RGIAEGLVFANGSLAHMTRKKESSSAIAHRGKRPRQKTVAEPMVRRLCAGGRRIRTIGSALDRQRFRGFVRVGTDLPAHRSSAVADLGVPIDVSGGGPRSRHSPPGSGVVTAWPGCRRWERIAERAAGRISKAAMPATGGGETNAIFAAEARGKILPRSLFQQRDHDQRGVNATPPGSHPAGSVLLPTGRVADRSAAR